MEEETRGLSLKLAQSEKGSWYFYMESPSGELACFGPYRENMELARRDAAAFLFNMNNPRVVIHFLDTRIVPHPTADVPAEHYLRDLFRRFKENEDAMKSFNEQIEKFPDPPVHPGPRDFEHEPAPVKKRHLSLVQD